MSGSYLCSAHSQYTLYAFCRTSSNYPISKNGIKLKRMIFLHHTLFPSPSLPPSLSSARAKTKYHMSCSIKTADQRPVLCIVSSVYSNLLLTKLSFIPSDLSPLCCLLLSTLQLLMLLFCRPWWERIPCISLKWRKDNSTTLPLLDCLDLCLNSLEHTGPQWNSSDALTCGRSSSAVSISFLLPSPLLQQSGAPSVCTIPLFESSRFQSGACLKMFEGDICRLQPVSCLRVKSADCGLSHVWGWNLQTVACLKMFEGDICRLQPVSCLRVKSADSGLSHVWGWNLQTVACLKMVEGDICRLWLVSCLRVTSADCGLSHVWGWHLLTTACLMFEGDICRLWPVSCLRVKSADCGLSQDGWGWHLQTVACLMFEGDICRLWLVSCLRVTSVDYSLSHVWGWHLQTVACLKMVEGDICRLWLVSCLRVTSADCGLSHVWGWHL